jgi:hypothetical protein
MRTSWLIQTSIVVVLAAVEVHLRQVEATLDDDDVEEWEDIKRVRESMAELAKLQPGGYQIDQTKLRWRGNSTSTRFRT